MILLILLGASLAYLMVSANQQTPYSELSAPHGKVIIRRDNFNIPYILALHHDNDAFFALGYVHAQDRFWQMEFQRRVASGTLSEVFGEKTLKQDEYLRTWGFYRASISAWRALDPKTKQLVHAYTQGVNVYLANNKLPLPFYLLRYKPKPWTVIDSIAWQKMMAWNLDSGWQRKIQQHLVAKQVGSKQVESLFPPYPEHAPTILSHRDLQQSNLLLTHVQKSHHVPNASSTIAMPALKQHLATSQAIRNQLGFNDKEGKGSNAWVVSGKLTESGKPILANDVHLPLTSPSLWYLAELKGPTLHVVGATIPGLPLIAIGHNEAIAWGVTHSYVDTQDLYIEDEKTAFTSRDEIINVRGKASIILKVKESKHGPIISSITQAGKVDQFVAIKWVALQEGDTTVASFAKLNYARNWDEFKQALASYVSPPQNFLYADTRGNIGYYLAGRIPLRKDWVGNFPISSKEKREWEGFIPFNELPHVYNPPEGFIATANNKIVPDEYPHSLTFRWNVPPYRAQRIIDEIRRHQVNLENTKALQIDTRSYLWEALRGSLLETVPLDKASKKGLEILKQWDGQVDINSQGATLFAYWYQTLIQGVDPQWVVEKLQEKVCYADLTTLVDCQSHLSKTLKDAMTMLIHEQGDDSDKWRWGRVHHAVFQEAGIGKSKAIGWLWNRREPSPGGDFTVNVGTYDAITKEQTIGATYRQVIDLGDFNQSFYVIPLGQVDNPLSLRNNDQLPLWLNGGYVAMGFHPGGF
jgi:penicillin G amidase